LTCWLYCTALSGQMGPVVPAYRGFHPRLLRFSHFVATIKGTCQPRYEKNNLMLNRKKGKRLYPYLRNNFRVLQRWKQEAISFF
jgi:hypothetical protein